MMISDVHQVVSDRRTKMHVEVEFEICGKGLNYHVIHFSIFRSSCDTLSVSRSLDGPASRYFIRQSGGELCSKNVSQIREILQQYNIDFEHPERCDTLLMYSIRNKY